MLPLARWGRLWQPPSRGQASDSWVDRLMRRALVPATLALTLLLCVPGRAAPPDPVLDQSFTSPSDLSSAINECCNFVAQTFTAGRDGKLVGVSIDVFDSTPTEPDAPVHVAIRNVVDGVPGQKVLAETVLASPDSPLSNRIMFDRHVKQRAGVRYAIVVNLVNPSSTTRAGWIGAGGDAYPRGDLCASFTNGTSWFCYTGEPEGPFDVHFQTYVRAHG
jgi:hypothetical protein